MRFFLFIALILILESCREDKVDPVVASCYSYENVRKAKTIVDAPVTVRLSGGLMIGSQLMASSSSAWGSCTCQKNLCRTVLPFM